MQDELLAWRASATIGYARGGKKIEEKKNGAEGRLFLQNTIGITFGVISPVSSNYNRLNSFNRAGDTCRCHTELFTSRFYFEKCARES